MDIGVVLSDRYELLEVVGTGGMGRIWRAHDRLLDRQVAVKVLSGELAATSAGVQRLRAEATRAAQVRHPNVVQVLDAVFDGDVAAIVMELVEGPDLAAVVPERGMPLDEALALVDGIAAGLHAVHEAGIVHRDLSPRNVLLDDGVPRLTDFGVAESLTDGGEQTQTVRGSVSYLAPEQATGGDVRPTADVYALGCLVTVLLTGRPPFEAEAPIGVVHQHVREQAPDLRERRPEVPAAVADAVAAALAKDPADRPADVSAFLAALGRPVALERTAPVAVGAVAGTAEHDATRVLSTVGVLDVGALPTTAVDVPSGIGAPPDADAPQPEPLVASQRPAPSRVALVVGIVLLLALAGWALARSSAQGDPLASDAAPGLTAAEQSPSERLAAELEQLRTVLTQQHAAGRVDDEVLASLDAQLATVEQRVAEGRMRDAEVELATLRATVTTSVEERGVSEEAGVALTAAIDEVAAALADVEDTAEPAPAPPAPASVDDAGDRQPEQNDNAGNGNGKGKGNKGKAKGKKDR